MKKYAIFGGSFDPPHLCHEKIVSLCIEELKLDKLFVVPTFLSPFKSSFAASPDVRYEWLHEIFKEQVDVEVLDIEIKKQRAVYMIETATEIAKIVGKQSCDKIYLIIGSDNLVDLSKWHRYEELIELVEPIVISREGVASDEYETILLDCSFSSSGFRKSLDASMIPEKIREAVMSFYKGKN